MRNLTLSMSDRWYDKLGVSVNLGLYTFYFPIVTLFFYDMFNVIIRLQ